MSKKITIGLVSAGVILVSMFGAGGNEQPAKTDLVESTDSINTKTVEAKKVTSTCDGKTVTENCELKGVGYKSYVYRPAVAEKSHEETVTTFREEVTGYCTLCVDGTYSPSCATGRGACSYHGGVAEWNAPRMSSVPVEKTKKVIDEPAKKAFIEKTLN